MVYLETFYFPSVEKEEEKIQKLIENEERKPAINYITQNVYPFSILAHRLTSLDFEPITILYGGNGSGKSTILNVISNKLHISREAPYNSSYLMEKYVKMCSFKTDLRYTGEEFDLTKKRNSKYDIAEISKMITSDDVFKKMIDKRLKDEQKRFKSEMLIAKKQKQKRDCIMPKSINFEDRRSVEEFNDFYTMRKNSYTQYLKKTIGEVEPSFSNGETGLMYLMEQIADPGLYLLDEPENSMSCETQLKLVEFIELSARAFNTQFIIATHSPFLLSIPNAKIYNLDTRPVSLSKWWELENMKHYFELFNKYQKEFQQS
jgi:AAA ATPase